MKRFHTLQFRISALLFAFGCALIVMSVVRQYRREVETQRELMRINAYTEGTRLSGLAQHFLRRRLPQAADLAISYASVQPDLRLGVMCDGLDVIRNATEKQWRGVTLSGSPLAELQPLVEEARASMEGHIEEMQKGVRLVGIFPFWDVVGGLSKGVVILDYDLEGPVLAAQSRVLRESLAQGCALLGSCMLLWALMNVMVTSRVRFIEEQTRHIGLNGEMATPMQGDDELALISQGIAEAVGSLQRTERRFSQIASTIRDVFWIAPAARTASVYVNESYEALSGRPAGWLQHRRWDWLRTIVPEDRRKALELLSNLRKATGEVDMELRLLGRDDLPSRWMQVRAFSVAADGSGPGALQVVGVAMDISDKKGVEKRMLEAAEDERRRIGQDLHDDVCQRLAAAQLKSGVLRATLQRLGMPQADLAGDVANELAETTDIARGFARGLAPVAMGVAALQESVEKLCGFLRRAFGVECSSSCQSLDGLLDEEGATQVYRIAQELATNAAKHAKPTKIAISLVAADHIARLEVAHDGLSFDPSTTPHSGMGLHLMQQRVDALGATLVFHNRPAGVGGSAAICEIPLTTDPRLSTSTTR